MKKEICLVNKDVTQNTINFAVWADSLCHIETFIEEIQTHRLDNLPEPMKYEHKEAFGYWINVSVLEESFDKVVRDIKTIFRDNERCFIVADFDEFPWIR